MPTREFFHARADECRIEAETATLDNVRNRALRSQAAWQDMADRLDRTEAMRATRDAERASVDAER